MKAHPCICRTRKCDLWLCEKLLIARANSASLLNKRDELISKCRCMNKFTVKCFKKRCYSRDIVCKYVPFVLGIKQIL